jgi:hypothetical protein
MQLVILDTVIVVFKHSSEMSILCFNIDTVTCDRLCGLVVRGPGC